MTLLRGGSWLLAALTVAALSYWAFEALEAPANQVFGKTVVSGPAGERIVALTYDDGPNPPYTEDILALLEREKVHATFFVVGRAVAEDPAAVARMVKDGDAVGNHSWDHSHLLVLDAAHVSRSLRDTDAAVYAAARIHTTIMRPPFGQRDWLVMDQIRRLGYTPVMWSVPLADDWENPPPATIAARILPYVHDGSIIVLHDGNRGLNCRHDRLPVRVCDRANDIEATRLIVESLKREGYSFVTVPAMLHARPVMHIAGRSSE